MKPQLLINNNLIFHISTAHSIIHYTSLSQSWNLIAWGNYFTYLEIRKKQFDCHLAKIVIYYLRLNFSLTSIEYRMLPIHSTPLFIFTCCFWFCIVNIRIQLSWCLSLFIPSITLKVFLHLQLWVRDQISFFFLTTMQV